MFCYQDLHGQKFLFLFSIFNLDEDKSYFSSFITVGNGNSMMLGTSIDIFSAPAQIYEQKFPIYNCYMLAFLSFSKIMNLCQSIEKKQKLNIQISMADLKSVKSLRRHQLMSYNGKGKYKMISKKPNQYIQNPRNK